MSMPRYAQDAIHNQGQGGGFNFGGIGSDLGRIFSGLFTDPSKPYNQASDVLNQYYQQAQGYQNPFLNMGRGAIPQYQQWLQGQQNPSGFINNLMGQYQESPYAKFQQQQGLRAAQNMGSASGLTGSTPLMQFAQQNAQNISSQDMNQWLQNVLGINTQYGAGLQNELGYGQNAANSLSNMASQFGGAQAGLQFGGEYANQQNRGNMFGGIGDLAEKGLGYFFGQ